MKIIVAGSRNITNYEVVEKAIQLSQFDITELVSGGARGVDKLGEDWADNNNIHVKLFEADWDRFGKPAGPIRNRQMGDYADGLIAIWNGFSYGTKDMIDYAQKLNLYVFVVNENLNILIDDRAKQMSLFE